MKFNLQHLMPSGSKPLSRTPELLRGKRSAFTLVELLIVLAILSILAALLFAVMSRVQEEGRRASCASNLRQIGIALQQYTEDYDGFYPSLALDGYDKSCQSSYWQLPAAEMTTLPLLSDTLMPYVGISSVFVCPSTHEIRDNDADGGACPVSNSEFAKWPMTYVQRTELSMEQVRVSSLSNAAQVDVLHCHGSFHGGDDPNRRTSNVLFVDGHVKFLQRAQLIETSGTRWQYE